MRKFLHEEQPSPVERPNIASCCCGHGTGWDDTSLPTREAAALILASEAPRRRPESPHGRTWPDHLLWQPWRSEHEIPEKGKELSQSPGLRHWTAPSHQAPGRAQQVLPLVRSARLPCRQAQLDCAERVVAICRQEPSPTLCPALGGTPGRVSGMGPNLENHMGLSVGLLLPWEGELTLQDL